MMETLILFIVAFSLNHSPLRPANPHAKQIQQVKQDKQAQEEVVYPALKLVDAKIIGLGTDPDPETSVVTPPPADVDDTDSVFQPASPPDAVMDAQDRAPPQALTVDAGEPESDLYPASEGWVELDF